MHFHTLIIGFFTDFPTFGSEPQKNETLKGVCLCQEVKVGVLGGFDSYSARQLNSLGWLRGVKKAMLLFWVEFFIQSLALVISPGCYIFMNSINSNFSEIHSNKQPYFIYTTIYWDFFIN